MHEQTATIKNDLDYCMNLLKKLSLDNKQLAEKAAICVYIQTPYLLLDSLTENNMALARLIWGNKTEHHLKQMVISVDKFAYLLQNISYGKEYLRNKDK